MESNRNRNLGGVLPKLIFTSLSSHPEYYGDERSKDAMIEILRIVLRQQVYPHVVRGLGPYRLSIDNDIRRQIAKQVVLEVCREEFMDNLLRNNDYLPAAFERELAFTTRSLCHQYAEGVLNDLAEGQACYQGLGHDPLLKGDQESETLQPRKDFNAVQVDNAAHNAPQSSEDSEMPEEVETVARIMEQLGI